MNENTNIIDTSWEFGDRHRNIAENMLIPGEEISWPSCKKNEFDGETVYKTLRKTASGDVTFLVESYPGRDRVLTVGTYYLEDYK